MKKVLLSILTFGMVLTLSACGNKQNSSIDDNKGSNQEASQKFEDLTMTRMVGSFDDVWVDLPNWREDGSETCTVIESYNYYIIGVISKEDYSFEELFNNVAKSDLRHFVDRGTYDDFVPETQEEVTLSNGIKATKFEGTLRLEDYGDKYEYPAYGYYFKFNNYPIMFMSVETATGSIHNSEEERLNTNKYVDKIVQTVKSSK